MRYRAVLFDIDGTLLDTLQDIADSANRVMSRYSYPVHKTDDYKYFVGDGVEALAERILPQDQRLPSIIAMVVSEINVEYGQHWADTTRPYGGIRELLRELVHRGVMIAALSNKPHGSAQLTVSRLLPEACFEAVLGVSPSLPRKPDPAGALQIARQLGLETGECLYLGDTGTDMRTAVAAGMYPVGALWGFRTARELLENGARTLLSDPLELLTLL